MEGIKERFSVIVNSKTGRAKLGSKLSKKEYNHLKKNGELNLFDLRRDPQTLATNKKSVAEAEALKRAQEQGLLGDFIVRRPQNTTETQVDFIGESITDSIKRKKEIDFKATERTGKRDFQTQTVDIIESIQDDLESSNDPLNFIHICDLAPAPNFVKRDIYENIQNGLDPNEFDQTKFLFDEKLFNN